MHGTDERKREPFQDVLTKDNIFLQRLKQFSASNPSSYFSKFSKNQSDENFIGRLINWKVSFKDSETSFILDEKIINRCGALKKYFENYKQTGNELNSLITLDENSFSEILRSQNPRILTKIATDPFYSTLLIKYLYGFPIQAEIQAYDYASHQKKMRNLDLKGYPLHSLGNKILFFTNLLCFSNALEVDSSYISDSTQDKDSNGTAEKKQKKLLDFDSYVSKHFLSSIYDSNQAKDCLELLDLLLFKPKDSKISKDYNSICAFWEIDEETRKKKIIPFLENIYYFMIETACCQCKELYKMQFSTRTFQEILEHKETNTKKYSRSFDLNTKFTIIYPGTNNYYNSCSNNSITQLTASKDHGSSAFKRHLLSYFSENCDLELKYSNSSENPDISQFSSFILVALSPFFFRTVLLRQKSNDNEKISIDLSKFVERFDDSTKIALRPSIETLLPCLIKNDIPNNFNCSQEPNGYSMKKLFLALIFFDLFMMSGVVNHVRALLLNTLARNSKIILQYSAEIAHESGSDKDLGNSVQNNSTISEKKKKKELMESSQQEKEELFLLVKKFENLSCVKPILEFFVEDQLGKENKNRNSKPKLIIRQ